MSKYVNADDLFPEIAFPSCFSFDRVTNGISSSSDTRLLDLPVEIIGNISRYFSSTDLASLALVNSDCRELARSHQLEDLVLNYHKASSQVLGKLCTEVQRRET